MIENTNSYVDFLIKHKLSPNQFLLLQVLSEEVMFKELGSNALRFKKVGNIYKWVNEGKGWTKEEIEDLINKEFLFGIKSLQKINGKEEYNYYIDQLILTQSFSDIMYINSIFAFDEILELYPDKFYINNQTVFTKSGDLDKIRDNYNKLIKGSITKHQETKDIILFAKEKNLCNYKLENFLNKEVLKTIKKMMEDTYEPGTDI